MPSLRLHLVVIPVTGRRFLGRLARMVFGILPCWYIVLYILPMAATMTSSNTATQGKTDEVAARIAVAPLADTSTFAERAYTALRDVILALDIYGRRDEIRLDERPPAGRLGITRTPVLQATAALERGGVGRPGARRRTH